MPTALLGFCATKGCPARVKSGHCQDHTGERRVIAEARHQPSVRELHTNRWKLYSKRRLALYPWCAGYPRGVHAAAGRVLAECTDHIKAAREYPDLFWDEANHQSLCGDCNKRKNIAEESGFRG